MKISTGTSNITKVRAKSLEVKPLDKVKDKLPRNHADNLAKWKELREKGKITPSHKSFTVEKWKVWLKRQNVEAGKSSGEVELDEQEKRLKNGIREFREVLREAGRK